MTYVFEMDFYNDWISHLRNILEKSGYVPAKDNQEVSFQYFNLLRRNVSPIPRKILIAKEFKCPDSVQKGLEIVKEKIEKGIELRPHLSRKLSDLDYDDDLLNDWDIYHLHLGTTMDKDGFITRTGPVLFVRFDTHHAYLIDVMEHGNWANQKLIRIIHQNWPESIERFRMHEATGLNNSVTDKDIKAYRSSHSYSLVEPEPGVVYAPPGMGLTSSGIGVEVVRASDRYAMLMKDYESVIKENIGDIETRFIDEGRKLGKKLSFALKIKESNVSAYEKNHNIYIDLGEIP